MYKVYGNVLSTGTKERTIEVLGGFGHSRMCVLFREYEYRKMYMTTRMSMSSRVIIE